MSDRANQKLADLRGRQSWRIRLAEPPLILLSHGSFAVRQLARSEAVVGGEFDR
jgi:hypothetical protein